MITGAPVNVLDYGADPTGANDSTTAIQAAVNAGSVVEFPAGEYLISANINLPSSVALVGAGYEFVTIKSTANRSLISDGGTSPSNGNNLFVKGLAFSGVTIVCKDYIEQLNIFASYFTSGAVAGNAYNAILTDAPTVETYTKIQNAEIADCKFYDVRRAIYLFRGFDYVNIHDNYIDTAAQNGIWISSYQTNNDLSYSVTANISNNTIKNVGGDANETYISAIDLYAVNSVVTGNRIENVKNINYWEVDGIYVKGQYSVISNNQLVNGGYRSNIQTKQMGDGGGIGLNNGQIPAQSIVIANNSIYMDETDGYTGTAAGVFLTLNYAGKVFGGINIVTDNTLVTGNYIYGAGTGIYAVNSYTLWLVNNVTISNNTIAANRGAAAILWGCAGENIAFSRNSIINPTDAFSMGRFYGLYIYFDNSYFLPRGSTASWIASNADYDLRRIRNLTFSDNIIDASLSVSGTMRGLSLAISDSSMGGGDVAVDPGSFDSVTVKGNIVKIANGGAGDGFGFYTVDENDRYPNLNFDVSTNIAVSATTANFLPPTGYVQTLRMNNYRLWVDPTSGDLYIKNGIPANNTDGTVVGTQT
jgi:hypothetical protein